MAASLRRRELLVDAGPIVVADELLVVLEVHAVVAADEGARFHVEEHGLDTVMHAAKAIENVLIDMKSGKFAHRNDGMDFEDYKKLVGYDKWQSIDERFAPRQ